MPGPSWTRSLGTNHRLHPHSLQLQRTNLHVLLFRRSPRRRRLRLSQSLNLSMSPKAVSSKRRPRKNSSLRKSSLRRRLPRPKRRKSLAIGGRSQTTPSNMTISNRSPKSKSQLSHPRRKNPKPSNASKLKKIVAKRSSLSAWPNWKPNSKT